MPALKALAGRVQREVLTTMFTPREIEYLYEEQRITVPVTSLSALMEREKLETIDLLELDVEGSEIDIFRGTRPKDWNRIRQLSMEEHDCDALLPVVLDLLESAGIDTMVDESTRDAYGDIVLTATHR